MRRSGCCLPRVLARAGAGVGRAPAEQRVGELPLGHLWNEHTEGGRGILLAIQTR